MSPRTGPLLICVLVLAGCGGGRTGAQIASAKLDDRVLPKCELPSTAPVPKVEWQTREAAFASIGRALGTKEYDEPVVLDALSREVVAVTDAGSCMPTFTSTPTGAVTYELRCSRLDAQVKARAERLEKLVRDEGQKLLVASAALEKCRFRTMTTKTHFASAAQGSLKAGKATSVAAGCSYADDSACEKACADGSAQACSTFAMKIKDPLERNKVWLRGCDLALDEARTSVKDVRTLCAIMGVDATSEAGRSRIARFVDRTCSAPDAHEAPACWIVLDRESPTYRPSLAKDLASRIDCTGDKPCPVHQLLDREAPHYDAARAEKLAARIDDACAKRQKACFTLGSGAWRALDGAPKKRLADAFIAECDAKGPHAGYACGPALAALSKGGVAESIDKAKLLAARLCDENEHMCGVAADCTEKGTCAPAPDRVAARAYFERACAVLVKIDANKPRAEWPACKRADELSAGH